MATGNGNGEAQKLISLLSRTCRQTLVFMEGKSCMDEKRVKQTLQHAIKACDKYRR